MEVLSSTMRKCKLTVQRGSKALEMIMRDVLDNIEDGANYIQYQSSVESVQILSVELPENNDQNNTTQITNIYSVSNPPILHRSKDVVSYLLEREEKQSPPLSA